MSLKHITPALLLLLPLTGIACSSEATDVSAKPQQLRVLATFLPMWVFAANVADDVPGVEVELLLAAETGCPHDYSLSPGELKKIKGADILIANGVVEPFLASINSNYTHLKILRTIEDVRSPLYDGEDHHGHDHMHDSVPNPHTWVSPTYAIKHVRTIANAFKEELPIHKAAFENNADRYISKLRKSENDVKALSGILTERNAITIHNAFVYLFADLGIEVIAVIGQPTTPRKIAGIESLVREDGAVIFSEPQFPKRIHTMIVSDLNVTPYQLDPVASGEQSMTLYEETMRTNLETIRTAMVKP